MWKSAIRRSHRSLYTDRDQRHLNHQPTATTIEHTHCYYFVKSSNLTFTFITFERISIAELTRFLWFRFVCSGKAKNFVASCSTRNRVKIWIYMGPDISFYIASHLFILKSNTFVCVSGVRYVVYFFVLSSYMGMRISMASLRKYIWNGQ